MFARLSRSVLFLSTLVRNADTFRDSSHKEAPDLAAMQIRYFGSLPREHAWYSDFRFPNSGPWNREFQLSRASIKPIKRISGHANSHE